MSFLIRRFGRSVTITAGVDGLEIRGPHELATRECWPKDAILETGAWRTALEIEQLRELGFAESRDGVVLVPYRNFEEIRSEIPVGLMAAWTHDSPFLLKIDRKSDLGRPDFQYRYSFLLAGRPVHIERLGYYVRGASKPDLFLLDFQMYSLVEAMDSFNALSAEAKTPQQSWLTFAKVKGCAVEVGAEMDRTLRSNDVIVPSRLGLSMHVDPDGALSFLPKCPELAEADFYQVFRRNPEAEKLYSLDRPGLGRVRIVLSDDQHEVLRRMKKVRGVKGQLKERLVREPNIAFDGVEDPPEYGDRVIGVGQYQFSPTPRAQFGDSPMAGLWAQEADNNAEFYADAGAEADGVRLGGEGEGADCVETREVLASAECVDLVEPPEISHVAGDGVSSELGLAEGQAKKYLLIKTNEEYVPSEMLAAAEAAGLSSELLPFQRPRALREDRDLRPHQEAGVRWLQTCSAIAQRTGALLADDMGVGKTVQILTFLAWCIESGRFPGLSKQAPPFQPILIIAPLILVETRTWEKEMENFFSERGVIFWPVLLLHGQDLAKLRMDKVKGAELELGKPVLDLPRIQRHRVVITNYETVKSYQHSFASLVDGKPLWSFVVSDEAQEFKAPSTRISHAVKALKANMHIACTGTPVENRLLDLWNICDAIQPGLLASAKEFESEFERNQFSAGPDNRLVELKRRLKFQRPNAFLLRRTKADVADLPAKTVTRITCEMSDAEIAAHHALLTQINRGDKKVGHLSALQQFAQLYQHPSLLIAGAEDLEVAELINQSSKLRAFLSQLHVIRGKREKVIVFARLRAMQSILAKVLSSEFQLPVRIINGDTKMRGIASLNLNGRLTRDSILDDFKSRPGFNIVILSPFVAGIGLTIVEANHVVHYGRWWNPAVESQATDRVYRIGQNKPVTVYLPILTDPSGRITASFDERLDLLMEKKQRLAEDFLRPLQPEDEIASELFSGLNDEANQRN